MSEGLTPHSWTCSKCGCTDEGACPGGCYFVAPNLCSRCQAPELKEPREATRTITVRMPRDLYTRLRRASHLSQLSMNQFCIQQIDVAIQRAERANA
jgi:hypothetical protein